MRSRAIRCGAVRKRGMCIAGVDDALQAVAGPFVRTADRTEVLPARALEVLGADGRIGSAAHDTLRLLCRGPSGLPAWTGAR